MSRRIEIKLSSSTHSVLLGTPLEEIGALISTVLQASSFLIVTDSNVAPLHGATVLRSIRHSGYQAELEIISAGERNKTLRSASQLVDRLIEMGADRRTAVVAVGGGMIGDLAGFAAAIFARGIPLIHVPTSLLAMVDSSIGGKTGVNHPLGKNLIGAFHQPSLVVIDPGSLATLPPNEFRQGLAEVVKYAVAIDREFWYYLQTSTAQILARDPSLLLPMIETCVRRKVDVVQQDERETTGLRAKLNFGHTFAHAFETCSDHQIPHGDAVALGMICAATLAEKLGMCTGLAHEIRSLLSALAVPICLPMQLSTSDLLAAMKRDKKAQRSQLNFILPRAIGAVELTAVHDEASIVHAISIVMP